MTKQKTTAASARAGGSMSAEVVPAGITEAVFEYWKCDCYSAGVENGLCVNCGCNVTDVQTEGALTVGRLCEYLGWTSNGGERYTAMSSRLFVHLPDGSVFPIDGASVDSDGDRVFLRPAVSKLNKHVVWAIDRDLLPIVKDLANIMSIRGIKRRSLREETAGLHSWRRRAEAMLAGREVE